MRETGLQDILVLDMETWEAPEDMQKNYPYYLSGFDYENRPGSHLRSYACYQSGPPLL